MDRYLFDITRYVGDLLSATSSWQSVGDVDDLKAIDGASDDYVAATTSSTARRILLHRGRVTHSDHGVQAIINRGKPRRTGGRPIGLILMWKTAACDPDTTFIDSSESDESGVVGLFVCSPVTDVELGEANHIRIQIENDVLSIVERLEEEERTLWSMPLHSLHRRIAIRAEHVDGTVTLWWNPDGIPEFLDVPIARVSTLIDGGGRAGIFSHEDGRFLTVAVDYRIEQEAMSPLTRSAEVPAQNLVPVRLTITNPDLSRPSIQTGFLITPDRATRLPECQQHESRVYLRDARMFVTPGASYRPIGWMRTVDGDMVRAETMRQLAVSGTAEDLRLRDDEGRLVLFSEEATPAGELRSRRDYLEFPRALREAASVGVEGSLEPNETGAQDWHDATPRSVRRAFTAPRRWTVPFETMSPALEEELLAFFAKCRARQVPFLWSVPLTDEHVMVRFVEPKVQIQGVQRRTFRSQIEVVEDFWAFYVPTVEVPDEAGESDDSSGGGGTPPPGGCVPGEVVAVVPMYSRPDAGYGGLLGLSYDRDPARPAPPAAPLSLPDTVTLSFAPGEWSRDATKPGPADLSDVIAVLTGEEWTLEFQETATGYSNHWHHIRYSATPPFDDWYLNGGLGDLEVNRSTWMASRQVGDYTIEVRFVAEYAPDHAGADGALLNIFVFYNGLAPKYEEGNPDDDGYIFTRSDPVKWLGGSSKVGHPHLLVCAHIPTTFQAPIGNAWYPGNQTQDEQVDGDPVRNAVGNDRASCFVAGVGSPWSIPDPGFAYETLAGSPIGTHDRLNTVGTAGVHKTNQKMQLLGPAQDNKVAALWHTTKRDVVDGFDTTFSYTISEAVGGGGGGLALVVQADDEVAVGTGGAGLGYTGIEKSVAIEFDIALDASGDPDGNHVSVHTNGTGANSSDHAFSVLSATLVPSLHGTHTVRVVYEAGTPGTITVYLDGVQVLTGAVDLDAAVSGQKAWLGFTASSSTGARQRITINSWEFETSTAPVYGDPDDAIGNSVYGYNHTPYGWGALTLGGGCPTSELFQFVTIEDHEGLSALRPANPGWDVLRGGIDLTTASSITIECCLPVQEEAECCDFDTGSIECWPPNPNTSFQACLPRLSRMDLTITQLRIMTTDTYDGGGMPVSSSEFVGQTYIAHEGLWVDEIRYSEGSPHLRSYTWKAFKADPDYQYRGGSLDDFNDSTLTDWNQASGSWNESGTTATASSVSGYALLYRETPGTDHQMEDGTIQATVAGDATKIHVVAMRASTFSEAGMFGVLDGPNQTLSILRKSDDGTGGYESRVLASFAEVDTISSSGITATSFGSTFTLTYLAYSLSGADCEVTSGVWGLAAFADGAAYGQCLITDTGPDQVEMSVTLDANGWTVNIPAKAMPGYLDSTLCSGCNDCAGPFVSCSVTYTSSMAPDGIIGQPNAELPYHGVTPPTPQCDTAPPFDCPCLYQPFITLEANLYTGPWDSGYVNPCGDLEEVARRFKIWQHFICAIS